MATAFDILDVANFSVLSADGKIYSVSIDTAAIDESNGCYTIGHTIGSLEEKMQCSLREFEEPD